MNMSDYLTVPLRFFSFTLRNQLKWRRGLPPLTQESKEGLFSYLSLSPKKQKQAEKRHQELVDRYQLLPLKRLSLRQVYSDNLYLLDCLEDLLSGYLTDLDFFPSTAKKNLLALDIGCRNWDYVFALNQFLQNLPGSQSQPHELHGIEVDAYGIYPNFYSRLDYALAFTRQTENPNVHYHVGDFLKVPFPLVDVIFLFYPFLLPRPLLKWGLPLRFFQPQKIISKAVSLLQPGGMMIVFNQTMNERDRLLQILQNENVRILKTKMLESQLVSYYAQVEDRQGTVIMKNHKMAEF